MKEYYKLLGLNQKEVKTYELIQDNDKIMVCISGGKDSFLLAKCVQELKKHGKINFDANGSRL